MKRILGFFGLYLFIILCLSNALADEIRFLDIPWFSSILQTKDYINEKVTNETPIGSFSIVSWPTKRTYNGDERKVGNVPEFHLEYDIGHLSVAGLSVKKINMDFVPVGKNGKYNDMDTDDYQLVCAEYFFQELYSMGFSEIYSQLAEKMMLVYGEPTEKLNNCLNDMLCENQKGMVWKGDNETIVGLYYYKLPMSDLDNGEYVVISYAYDNEEFFKEKASLTSILVEDPKLATKYDNRKSDLLKQYLTIGSIVKFGHYEQDNNQDNGEEEIEWIVLDTRKGKSMLLSKYGIDCMSNYDDYVLNENYKGPYWEYSPFRAWLNDEFYNFAFNSEEKQSIIFSEVDNSIENAWVGEFPIKYDERPTIDKVYLLSGKEVNDYIPLADDRLCYPTEYAKKRGIDLSDNVFDNEINTCMWSLRSHNHYGIAVVSFDGDIIYSENSTENACTSALRPAIWIDIAELFPELSISLANNYNDSKADEYANAIVGPDGELYGIAIKELTTRAAPSPYAEDTGTFFVEGQRIQVYTRAYDQNGDAWWVKCSVPYHGENRTLWTWYSRFDQLSLPLEIIPIENSSNNYDFESVPEQGVTKTRTNVYISPSQFSEIDRILEPGEVVTIVDTITEDDGSQWYTINVNTYEFAYVMKEFIDIR